MLRMCSGLQGPLSHCHYVITRSMVSVCTLAIHHFGSLAKAASEISRICPSGPIVLLTIDPRLGEAFWFSEYFPSVYQRLFSTFPRIECVCTEFTKHGGFTSQVSVWLLPHNAVDTTMHSGWNKPEIYLDQSHRQNMSGLALASRVEIESGVSALRAALASGAWDRDHGYLRKRREIDLGFRFIKLAPVEAYEPQLSSNKVFP